MITTRGTNFFRTPGGDQFHKIIKISALSALLINFIRIVGREDLLVIQMEKNFSLQYILLEKVFTLIMKLLFCVSCFI